MSEVVEEEVATYEGPYANSLEEGPVKVDLYNANHGKAERNGGPYRDDLEAEEAEKRRAKLEGREPDLDNPPATVATVLVPKHQLVERDNDKSHYSDQVEVTNEPVDSYVVDPPESKPDPTQGAWDNDMQRIQSLEASNRLQEALQKQEQLSESEQLPEDKQEVN